MSRTASWDVNEEYWSEDKDGSEEVIEETTSYSDYGSEIESSRPAGGERGLI